MLYSVSPTDSSLMSSLLESAKRKLAKPVSKKKSITSELLDKMYTRLFSEGNVKNQRIICTCLKSYAGFLRSN